jgi:predicted Zn-dependent protease
VPRPPFLTSLAVLVLLAACASSAPASRPLDLAAPPPARLERAAASAVADARASRSAGDPAAAAATLEEALATGASDDLRLELADLLVADGRELGRAAALLAEVRDRERDVRFDLVSARLAELSGDDGAAAAAYARALLVEDDPDVRLRRALALDRLGLSAEARAELEAVRAARPGDVLARTQLAERYEADGRLADAERELVAAAEAAPDRAGTWKRLARFYARVRKPRAARDAEARARAIEGRDDRALRPLQRSSR